MDLPGAKWCLLQHRSSLTDGGIQHSCLQAADCVCFIVPLPCLVVVYATAIWSAIPDRGTVALHSDLPFADGSGTNNSPSKGTDALSPVHQTHCVKFKPAVARAVTAGATAGAAPAVDLHTCRVPLS
jgi:hypothetical protein